MSSSIPLARPDLKGHERDYVLEALDSTWISSRGKFIEQFEERFTTLCEAGATVPVTNGTAALHLALMAMGVQAGDEVIVPSLTYVATANAVRYVGGEPVFVDVDPDNWCMDPQLLEACITRRTKGIIVVHLYGHPADMDAINSIGAVHGLWVVEDAAEAHGARYRNRVVGSLADIGTFSFYGNKIITCGEGGAVTSQRPSLDTRLRTLQGQGVDPTRQYYFPVTGYNFRLTNVACALLVGQLERFDDIIARRRAIFGWYREGLDGLPGVSFQPVSDWATPAPWLFCATVDPAEAGYARQDLMKALGEAGIETRPFFIPLHTLPPFRREAMARGDHLPVTDRLAAAGLNLPTYNDMDRSTVERVVTAFRTFAGPRRA